MSAAPVTRSEIFVELVNYAQKLREEELTDSERPDGASESREPRAMGMYPKILNYLQLVEAKLQNIDALTNRVTALESENANLRLGLKHFKKIVFDGEVPSLPPPLSAVPKTPIPLSPAAKHTPTNTPKRVRNEKAGDVDAGQKAAKGSKDVTPHGSITMRKSALIASEALKNKSAQTEPKTTPKKPKKISRDASLSKAQRIDFSKQFLEFFSTHQEATNKDFQKPFSLNKNQVYEVFRYMKNEGLIEKHGTSFDSTWAIKA